MKIHLVDSMSALRLRLEAGERNIVQGVINDAFAPGRVTIFCWDGRGANDKRRAILPEYKTGRPPQGENIFKALNVLREMLSHTPAFQAQLEGFEADDLIAAFCQRYADGTTPIEIETRDGDLTALCTLPGVSCRAPSKVPAHQVRLYKLTRGDPSDKIPGLKGFGEKSWEAADKVGLEQLLQSLPLKAEDEARALAVGLSKGTFNWLCTQDGADLVGRMRRVIEPLPVTDAEIEAATSKGVPNQQRLSELCSKFMF